MTDPVDIEARGRRYLLFGADALVQLDTERARELLHAPAIAADDLLALAGRLVDAPGEIDAAIVAIAEAIGRGELLLAAIDPLHLAPVGPSGAPLSDDDWDTFVPLSDLVLPDATPTWCELELWLDEDGPLVGAELRASMSGGGAQTVVSDDDGVARIEGVAPGSVVEISLVRTPEWSERGHAPPLGARRVELADGVRIACPATARTVVVLTRAFVFDFDDVTFGNERAVFLPEPPVDHRTDTPSDAPCGLAALASVLAFARTHPEHALVVLGHTDAVGTGTSDVPLSEARATNVRLALFGDVEGWAAHTMTVWAVEDLQHALAWSAKSLGWACDPGPCDNELGPQTLAALGRFREQASAMDGTPIPAGEDVVVDDWRSIARRYEHALAGMLPDDPAAIRGALREQDGSPIGCAADRARRPPPDAIAGGTARRVELVFVPPVSGMPSDVDGIVEVVYASTAARLRYIPRFGSDAARTWITLRVVHAGDGQPLSGRRVRLRCAGIERELATDSAGRVTFADLPLGDTADVAVKGGGPGASAAAIASHDEVDDDAWMPGEMQGEGEPEPAPDELFEEAEDTDVVPPPPEPPEPPDDDEPQPSDRDEVDDDDIVDDDRGAA